MNKGKKVISQLSGHQSRVGKRKVPKGKKVGNVVAGLPHILKFIAAAHTTLFTPTPTSPPFQFYPSLLRLFIYYCIPKDLKKPKKKSPLILTTSQIQDFVSKSAKPLKSNF